MMTKEQFGEVMKDRIQEELGDGYEVKIQHVTKNNGVELMGLMVNDPLRNIAPTIYLDSMYEDVKQGGRSIDDCVGLAAYNIKHGMPSKRINMDYFTDYEQVKDKICFRLVNAEANKELLAKVPHEDFKDLAVTFFYPFEHDEIGRGTILIRNEHMENWGVTEKELMDAAKANTPRIFPPRCMPLDDVLMEIVSHKSAEESELPERPFNEDPCPMHILTNNNRVYGAGIMLYEDYLAKVAEAAGCDLYLLPCSVHEMVALPKDCGMSEDYLRDMVKSSNDTVVEEQDKLSNSVYAYDRQTQTLSVCEEQALKAGESETVVPEVPSDGMVLSM